MTTTIEPTTQTPGNWLRQQIGALLGRDYHEPKRKADRFNYPKRTFSKTHRAMIYSRHTHYDPLQIAIEEGLDAWARHAAASNGFGDLP
ncbi:MAG: hypothetical protein JSU67_10420 [Gammaproteobacteria bacterium]|nr:MAG: hypothetical protein JSU67_10420 [Gammaproteobacteria bacterium]